MPDSLTYLQGIAAQQQQFIFSFIKYIAAVILGPGFVALIGVLATQYFIGKRNSRMVIDGLVSKIDQKVDFSKHDESVRRFHTERESGDKELHKRLDEHIKDNSEQFNEIAEGIGYIRGRIDTALKNGKQDAQ